MKSPCIHTCSINKRTGFCIGCFRTLDEITAWGSLSAKDQKQILATLEKRKSNGDNTLHRFLTPK